MSAWAETKKRTYRPAELHKIMHLRFFRVQKMATEVSADFDRHSCLQSKLAPPLLKVEEQPFF
jgi:hypothetical protein